MLLGCIADDLTGATDLALMLARNGMRTVQVMGVPDAASIKAWAGFDAVVVALKSRTNDPAEAVAWSLAACDALTAAGARQIFFKYCSTFDSTDAGNIGPVAEALSEKLGSGVAVVNPAFPANKRSVYMGHLFVGDVLLSDSPMKDHPLTPMRDANLVRVLQRQTRMKVGLIPYAVVDRGDEAIGTAFAKAEAAGERFVVVDAISDGHLVAIGHAAATHRLITGGSGIAMGLADNFVDAGLMTRSDGAKPMTARPGRSAILAGSCSQATRGQVEAAMSAGVPTLRLDPLALARGRETADQILKWADTQSRDGSPVLIYSSDDPASVARVQAELGRDEAGHIVERTLAEVARGLVADNFTKLIVAGGETSGAVVGGLGVSAIEIGPEIDPGVPWTRSLDGSGLVLALKSGNFGAPDFFIKAWDKLA